VMFGLLAVAATCFAQAYAGAGPVKLIVDTDMSCDVDDVLALALALQLDARGETQVLAVLHNTGLRSGVGAVSVINHYYGRDDIPIGAYNGSFDDPGSVPPLDDFGKTVAGPYVVGLVTNFTDAPIKDYTQVPEATALYRKVLSEQVDNSVVICSIGFFSNLVNLLDSEPDEFSSLAGSELVAKKVKSIVIMGGVYPKSEGLSPSGYEWNFAGGCRWGTPGGCPRTKEMTAAFLDRWPASSAPMVFSGLEVGGRILTGSPLVAGNATLCAAAAASSPVAAAFKQYADWNTAYPDRMSWDPLSVLFAVRGAQGFFGIHAIGHNSLNVSDGSNAWSDATPPKAGKNGDQAYLKLIDGAQSPMAAMINELVCASPQHSRPMLV